MQQATPSTRSSASRAARFVNTTLLEGDDSVERYRRERSSRMLVRRRGVRLRPTGACTAQGTDTRQDTLEQRTRRAAAHAAARRSSAGSASRTHARRGVHRGRRACEAGACEQSDGLRVRARAVAHRGAARRPADQSRHGRHLDSVILGESFPAARFPDHRRDRGRRVRAGRTALRRSGWTLIPALRADYYRLDARGRRASTARTTRIRRRGRHRGLRRWRPSSASCASSARAGRRSSQYARGFRAPPPEDVNIGLELPLLQHPRGPESGPRAGDQRRLRARPALERPRR